MYWGFLNNHIFTTDVMRCDKCPRARFQTLQQYKQHKLECHYHCIDCNKSFINHLEAEFHAGNVHCDEHGIYSCRECPFKTFDYDYFTDHMKSNHSKFTEILVKAEQNEEEFSENTETSKSLEMEIDPLASVTDNTSNSNSIDNDLAQISVKIEPYCSPNSTQNTLSNFTYSERRDSLNPFENQVTSDLIAETPNDGRNDSTYVDSETINPDQLPDDTVRALCETQHLHKCTDCQRYFKSESDLQIHNLKYINCGSYLQLSQNVTNIHSKNVFEREIATNQETLKDILNKEKGTQIEYGQANGDDSIKIEELEQSEVFEPKEAPVVKAIETGTIFLIKWQLYFL